MKSDKIPKFIVGWLSGANGLFTRLDTKRNEGIVQCSVLGQRLGDRVADLNTNRTRDFLRHLTSEAHQNHRKVNLLQRKVYEVWDNPKKT